jgi:hypothetical protein
MPALQPVTAEIKALFGKACCAALHMICHSSRYCGSAVLLAIHSFAVMTANSV